MRAIWGWLAGVAAMALIATGFLLVRTVGAQSSAPAPKGPLPAADLDLLHDAQQALVRDCMVAAGFRYWPTVRLPHAALRDFPYVVDDLAWAKANGYGRQVRAALDRADRVEPNYTYYKSLPRDQQRALASALNGPSFGGISVESPLGGTLSHSSAGCETDSWQQLYGSATDWYQSSTIVLNLDSVRTSQVLQSPEYRIAVGPWSACMRQAGFAATDPAALRSQRAADQSSAAQVADVRAATAEATCAQSSGLSATAKKIDADYAGRLVRQYAAAFHTLWRIQVQALPKARDLAR